MMLFRKRARNLKEAALLVENYEDALCEDMDLDSLLQGDYRDVWSQEYPYDEREDEGEEQDLEDAYEGREDEREEGEGQESGEEEEDEIDWNEVFAFFARRAAILFEGTACNIAKIASHVGTVASRIKFALSFVSDKQKRF